MEKVYHYLSENRERAIWKPRYVSYFFAHSASKYNFYLFTAKHFKDQAGKKGFTLNDNEIHYIFEEHQKENRNNNRDILAKTKDRTRIYVFVGEPKYLVKFMNQMRVEQMFAEGKYMVIYLDQEELTYNDRGHRLWLQEAETEEFCPLQDPNNDHDPVLKQWKSLIVVAGSTYKDKDKDKDKEPFKDAVRKYNTKPPFNFPSPPFSILDIGPIYVPMYAAHLYDSVMLYATSLNGLITNTSGSADVYR